MLLKAVTAAIAGLMLAAAFAGCIGGEGGGGQTGEDVTQYVNPMIGSDSGPIGSSRNPTHGNVLPGPQLPHGMVKLGPDSNLESGNILSYDYDCGKIEGFSHTHLEGIGGSTNGYNHILLMPTTGEIKTEENDYASNFSHDSEVASPGYYAVTLDDYKVRAELTATEHAGFHKYTFQKSDRSNILVDVAHNKGIFIYGQAEIVGDDTIRGYGIYNVHPLISTMTVGALAGGTIGQAGATAIMTVYFCAKFSRPFDSYGTWSDMGISEGSASAMGNAVGAFATYSTSENETIFVKVGISAIDIDQARQSMEKEIPGWDFDGVRERARSIWGSLLERIKIEINSGNESYDREQKIKFYTALYHSMQHPTDYTEYGRYWIGYDGRGKVLEAEDGKHVYFDDWSTWDSFRTTHPLQTLVEPEICSDVVQSNVLAYEEGGWFDRATWHATGYSRVMIGNHVFPIIADAYSKGLRDFDVEKAYEGMTKNAMLHDLNPLSFEIMAGMVDLGTHQDYVLLGYVGFESDVTQSVSMTLEMAHDDWCLAQMSKALGKESDYEYFLERSKNYENHWDSSIGFMRPKLKPGIWLEPFDPATNDIGFCEANSWIYTWYAPHDIQRLISLMGGKEAFTNKLDEFFNGGYFDIANEPSFHIPYLYDYVGQPWKTQEKLRDIMNISYSTIPGGLPGNDDGGATSAWYVFNSMGIYPVCPGDLTYEIGSPLFDKVTIYLNSSYYPGGEFTIIANNNSPENKYIQSATLNGQPLTKPWISHSDLANGGELVFEMGHEPNLQWGVDFT